MQNEGVKITEEVFDNLLSVSMLSAEKIEKNVLSEQVESIIGYFEILNQFAEPQALLYKGHDISGLRNAEIGSNIPRFDLKNMSSEYMDGYFRVPKVL